MQDALETMVVRVIEEKVEVIVSAALAPPNTTLFESTADQIQARAILSHISFQKSTPYAQCDKPSNCPWRLRPCRVRDTQQRDASRATLLLATHPQLA